MWNRHLGQSPYIRFVIYGLFAIVCGVEANYNGGIKTRTYTQTEPQITTHTYTTQHRTHQYVPVNGGEYQYSHGSSQSHNHNQGNANNYQPTATHQSHGASTTAWVPSSYGHSDSSNSYQQQQQEGEYYQQQQPQYSRHHGDQQQYYHSQQQSHQKQQQPVFVQHSKVELQGPGNWQDSENSITDYYTGCPSGHTGQLPYAYDCRRFLNCWKGRGHIQSCSVGTVFNPETLECDRPDKVRCGASLALGAQTDVTHTSSHGDLQQKSQPNYRAGRFTDVSTSEVDILCPPDAKGLQPHPSDCTKFINCANGNVHIQDCGPGTAFSVSMEVCDFKDKVDCTGRGATTVNAVRQAKSQISCPADASGLYPHPHDCTKFLQCANGQTYVQNCGPGTAFDSVNLICDFKDKVNCASGSSTKSSKSYGENAASGQSENIVCPHGITGLHPHPYDCTKFLQCSNGQTYIQDCGPGTGFDSVNLICDFKDKVKCTSGSTWGSSKTSKSYEEHIVSVGHGTHSRNVECPHDVSGLYAHPYECEKFLQCSNGQTFIQNCGPGTGFDSVRLVCDYKEKVHCASGSTWGSTGVGSTTDHFHTQQTTSSSSSSSSSSSHSSSGSPSDLPHNADILCLGGITGIFPYPFDYTKFINCKNGNTAIQNCVHGTAFSISKGYCEALEQIEKSDHVMYIVSEVSYEYSQTLITCPPGTEGIHLYPFNAEKYVKCVSSQMEVVSCPSSKVFSTTRRLCLPIDQVLKYERVRLSSELKKSDSYRFTDEFFDVHTMVYCPLGLSGTYPHPFDNSKYILCGGGRMIRESCASGKAYSLSRKECDMKEDIESTDRVPQAQLSYGSDWRVTDMETTFGSTDGLTYLMCPPGLSGYFLHPFDCTKYLKCENGATKVETCPNGSVFSISRKECIPRDRVEAYDRVEYWVTTQHELSNEHAIRSDHDLGFNCGSGTFGVYPHPQDYRMYIRCANGRITVEYCAPGQVFSIQRSFCHNENEVSQHDRSAYTKSHESGQHSQTQYTHGGTGSTSTTTTTTTSRGNGYNSEAFIPEHKDINCPTTTSNGRYAHPYDCAKFIMCSNGEAHIQSCGPGTAWNQAMEVCDFKDKVDCSQTGSVTKSNQPEILCPAGVEGLYEHPYDWRKYLSCSHGRTYIMECGPGTVFSLTRKICDLEANVVNTDRCNNGVYRNDYDYTYTQNTNSNSNGYGTGTNQWTNTQHQPATTTYTQTQQNANDRWSSMNVPRPQGSTYNQQTGTWIHSSNSQPPSATNPQSSNSWTSAVNVNHQTPTETVIYEQGSFQPDREQHHLVSTSVRPGSHSTSTVYESHGTTVESQRSTSAQSHKHNTNWHNHHQHNPSSSKIHSREFHEKHPNLPNPFGETHDTFDIDIRSNDDCPFSCGNGRCIQRHEVCNGVDNCGNRKDELQCDHLGYEVRLTGGESSNKGRVEVKILGKWGYVCDDKFGLKDADVLCRELGFKMGAMEVRGSSYYPPSDLNTYFAMDEVECKGNETSLRECDFKGWGVNNCGPDEVVGVVCKVQKMKCPDNYWLCSKSEECIPTAFVCDATADCSDGSDESPQVCNAPIQYRLEGGRTKNEGRLEVLYRGEWGTVCDDDFGVKEAQVVCNSLGFYGKPEVAKNIYGPGSGPIWLDQVSCLGNETCLDKCNHFTFGENNCQHTEDVGLKCTAGPKLAQTAVPVIPTTDTQYELEYEQSELDDLGKYQGLWQRSSKAVHQQKQCGHFKKDLLDEYAHPEERVINGSIAKRGRHPWQATIRTRGRGGISSHWCGAVIISKKLILTAAHCLAGYPKGSYFVRMGDHYANIAESSEIDSNIENWYIHEKFRDLKHMNNDIALILLKTPVRFNDYIQPICLPEKGAQLQANRKCSISGWGSIKSGTSTPSNILRAAEVPILAEDVCSRKDVYANAMSEGMFCAGFLDENADACDGDSGGPLVCPDAGGETLYGIISWGQHCGYKNHPGVYVRVEKYIDWIYEKINLMIQQGKL